MVLVTVETSVFYCQSCTPKQKVCTVTVSVLIVIVEVLVVTMVVV